VEACVDPYGLEKTLQLLKEFSLSKIKILPNVKTQWRVPELICWIVYDIFKYLVHVKGKTVRTAKKNQ
jgi:hypothetical protein